MTKRDIALKYIKYFCAGDIDGLAPLLAADLRFTGPFHRYTSAAGYLGGLRRDPPEKCGYRILSLTENEDAVAVFYDYEKPESTVRIAQLFKIKDLRITEIMLIFDSGALARQAP